MITSTWTRNYSVLFFSFISYLSFGQGIGHIDISAPPGTGINMTSPGADGIFIQNAGDDGLQINGAGDVGVAVEDVGRYGVAVDNSADHAFYVLNTQADGVFVENANGFSMNIQGNKNIAGEVSGHIAQIYNRSIGTGPDVLALKVGATGNLGGGVNFLTFYDGDDEGMGSIEGNGSGGVTFKSGGADFAEYLPVQEFQTVYTPGDIVAVQDGHISLITNDAPQLMVITDQPAILGNDQENTDNFEKVSFVGQVPINVRGIVKAGDWIISAGQNDGTGIAKPAEKLLISDQIVGLSLESSTETHVKKINSIVGLDHSQAIKDHLLADMQTTIADQKNEIKQLKEDMIQIKELLLRKEDVRLERDH